MKIKFEIRLTASKALLAVLAAMVGLSVRADGDETPKSASQEDFEKIVAKQAPQGIVSGEEAPAPAPETKKRPSRTAAPKADPIPEKIVPPPVLKAEEAIEQEEQYVQSPVEEPEVKITIEEVRSFGGALIQKNDAKFRPLVMEVLIKHKAFKREEGKPVQPKFSELDPSEFAGTLADLKALQ